MREISEKLNELVNECVARLEAFNDQFFQLSEQKKLLDAQAQQQAEQKVSLLNRENTVREQESRLFTNEQLAEKHFEHINTVSEFDASKAKFEEEQKEARKKIEEELASIQIWKDKLASMQEDLEKDKKEYRAKMLDEIYKEVTARKNAE